MRRRDLLFPILLTIAAFVAVGVFHNFGYVRKSIQVIRDVGRGEEAVQVPSAPFVLATVRIAGFYILAAIVMGGVFGLLASLLTRPGAGSRDELERNPESRRAVEKARRRRYYLAFVGLLLAFLVYVHLRMITLFPGLFRNSYKYDWFAGSSTWAFLVELAGRIALVVLGFALVIKYKEAFVAQWRGSRHRTVKFALLCVGIVFAAGLVYLVGWRGGFDAVPSQRPPTRPNIIFIGVDSGRPDHVSALGYPRPTTPSIDRFLDDAVWFDRAFVPLCRTHASWAAFLTGCNPPRNGVRFNLPPPDHNTPRVPTLAHRLREQGYSTAFFLNNTNYAWLDPSWGFDRLVQPEPNLVDFYLSHHQPTTILYYFFTNSRLGYLYDRGLRYNAGYAALYRPKPFDNEVVAHCRRARKDGPFFVGVHLCNLHAPFAVNYPYSTYFAPQTGPVLNRFSYAILLEEIARRKQVRYGWKKDEAERIYSQEINLYDALLRSCDDSVGRILRGLKKAGLYDDSLIVLFSDHGEHLYKGGIRYQYHNSIHGTHIWGDEDQHIVLAIKFPQRKHTGRVVARLVRSIDVASTVLDALDLPPLEQVEGISLLPYVEEAPTTSPPSAGQNDRGLIAYAETGLHFEDFIFPGHLGYAFETYFDLHYVENERIYKKIEYMPNLVMVKDRMVRDDRWKLAAYPIVREGRLAFHTELFDTWTDPDNLEDVATSHPAVVKRLRAHIWPYIHSDWKRWGVRMSAPLPVAKGTGSVKLPVGLRDPSTALPLLLPDVEEKE